MMRRAFLVWALARVMAFGALPPPVDTSSPGLIRVWGTAELQPLLERWQEGFAKTHPQVRFESRLTGSDIGLPGLYTRRADLALLGRAATDAEIKAFEWIFRYKPAAIEIATGSLGEPGRSPALIIYVHRDNPLARLTLAQLDAAFGSEWLRGAPEKIRTWGQLGLTGEWRERPIHLYAPDTEEGTGRFFRSVVLHDSRMLDWDHLREFADTKALPAAHDAAQKILAALAVDPLGLAVAGASPTDPRVKSLALAAAAAGPFVAPTRETLIARTYPLTRAVFAYVNRAPGALLDANVREFLDYVVGRDGQRVMGEAGPYLPLETGAATAAQRALR